MSYNYVVTAQKPTAVNGCVTGEIALAEDPGKGGIPGLGRPAASGAAGAKTWAPGMEGAGSRGTSPLARDLKGAVPPRAFWAAEAAILGPFLLIGGHLLLRIGPGLVGRRAKYE